MVQVTQPDALNHQPRRSDQTKSVDLYEIKRALTAILEETELLANPSTRDLSIRGIKREASELLKTIGDPPKPHEQHVFRAFIALLAGVERVENLLPEGARADIKERVRKAKLVVYEKKPWPEK